MTVLVNRPFAETFVFSRAAAASYRDPSGELAMAGADQPRFDHNKTGVPRGLIVQGRPVTIAPDRLRLASGSWTTAIATVLHAYEDPAGSIRQQAWYAGGDARTVVECCLNIQARHRLIACVPGHLINRGGFVRWRRQFYQLGSVLLVDDGLALAATADLPMLEG